MPKGGYRVGAGRPTGTKSVNKNPRKKVLTPRVVKPKTAKSAPIDRVVIPREPAPTSVEPSDTFVEPAGTARLPEQTCDSQDMISPDDYRFGGWEDFALYVLNAPSVEVPMADKIRAMQALSASENRRKTQSGEKTKEKRAAEKSSRDGVMGAGSKFAPRSV